MHTPRPLVLATASALLTTAMLASAVPERASAQGAADSLSTAADKGRILGSDKAAVWMLIVSDFQCPFCKRWHSETWETLRKEYVATGKVRVAYVHMPLGMHPNARPMAIASMCASAQGKFWPMADAIFKGQESWKDAKDPRPAIEAAGKEAGLDGARLKTCLDAPSIAAMVDGDKVRMTRAGAGSTPTFFIGDSKVEGAQPLPVFKKAIDAALAAAAKAKR
jgi:protein-disulfide isomerase